MPRIELALECPTGLLRQINPLGDFDYVSVDQFLDDKSYSYYYLNNSRHKVYLSTRKAFSFGPVGYLDIYKVWHSFDGRCSIIGPDFYNNLEETLEAYRLLENKTGMESIGIVQGRNMKEALKCLDFYGKWVALPFDVASPLGASLQTKMTSRAELVSKCRDRNVHLLGITSLEELSWYRGMSHVRSINTGLPIKLGLSGTSIEGYGKEKERDSRQYMDMYSQKFPGNLELVFSNIRKLREVLNGKDV